MLHLCMCIIKLVFWSVQYAVFLQVVDVGSGKGYLSEYLARCSGVTVVGLDSQPMNTRGALNRKQKVFSSIQC